MTPDHFEKTESVFSYLIGIAGMVVPSLMTFATEALHLFTMIGGALIILFRLVHDYRQFKKEK